MFVGIDPDLHDTAIAFWDNGGPVGAKVVHVPKKRGVIGQAAVLEMVQALGQQLWSAEGVEGIAVEAQTLRRRGVKQHKRPEDIVILGNVAGAILGFCNDKIWPSKLRFPTPEAWKGSVAKHAMQARLYQDLEWGYDLVGKGPTWDYARPIRPPGTFAHITKGQWKHVGDALLLAKWASENIK